MTEGPIIPQHVGGHDVRFWGRSCGLRRQALSRMRRRRRSKPAPAVHRSFYGFDSAKSRTWPATACNSGQLARTSVSWVCSSEARCCGSVMIQRVMRRGFGTTGRAGSGGRGRPLGVQPAADRLGEIEVVTPQAGDLAAAQPAQRDQSPQRRQRIVSDQVQERHDALGIPHGDRRAPSRRTPQLDAFRRPHHPRDPGRLHLPCAERRVEPEVATSTRRVQRAAQHRQHAGHCRSGQHPAPSGFAGDRVHRPMDIARLELR